jgi:hypothetical protein
MSYNPFRGQKAPKRRPPNARSGGKKHSTIVARSGPQAISMVEMQNRQASPHGWFVPHFLGSEFEVVYHYFCAKNDTGELRNDKQDRSVRVIAGQIFVMLSGNQDPVVLNAHQTFSLEKGVTYRLATSGTVDAELLFCQGAGYEASVEHVSAPGSLNQHQAFRPAEPSNEVPRRSPEVIKQHAEVAAKLQTEKQAARKAPVRKPIRAPLSGQTVIGVNPKPIGVGGYSDE